MEKPIDALVLAEFARIGGQVHIDRVLDAFGLSGRPPACSADVMGAVARLVLAGRLRRCEFPLRSTFEVVSR